MVALFHHKNLFPIKKMQCWCLAKVAYQIQSPSSHSIYMRLFLTWLSGRGEVLRKTASFPATFSNLSAVWYGYRTLGEVQGLTHLGLRDTRKKKLPVRDTPGRLLTGTEMLEFPGHWRWSGRQVGPVCSGPGVWAVQVSLNISAHAGGPRGSVWTAGARDKRKWPRVVPVEV